MNKIAKILHLNYQKKRFNIFFKHFGDKKGKLLDLGGADGAFLGRFRNNLVNFEISVADINDSSLLKAKKYGFKTILLDETALFPFHDKEFDIVFCNSLIEHYTGPKQKIFNLKKSEQFRNIAFKNQKFLASEIKRISKSYFVQTPYKFFPIESHTQFPFVGYLSRSLQVLIIGILNKFWIKKTQPDWYLLSIKEMQLLFSDAKIISENFFGITKSIIALKN